MYVDMHNVCMYVQLNSPAVVIGIDSGITKVGTAMTKSQLRSIYC